MPGLPELTPIEARVIGCLMEKSVTTPGQYPLTLNALTNACNQKSARNPVMSLDKGEVQHTVRQLDTKNFVRIEENFKSGTEKYTQRICNTRYSNYDFDPAQFAVICVLLLRGARTPGELRANCARLHAFADNTDVVSTLNSLIEWQDDPLVVKLPRVPGRRDAEYMHLLSGPIDVEEYASQAQAAKAASPSARTSVHGLAERVSALEAEVAKIKAQLDDSQR